jgi:hypothetical protein
VGSKKFLLKYWTELCGIRHQGKYHDSKDKLPYAESLVTEKKRRQDRTPDKWEPPPEGWLMINVDGAFDERTGEGGTGVVIRDHTGKITLTAWSFFQGEEVRKKQSFQHAGRASTLLLTGARGVYC